MSKSEPGCGTLTVPFFLIGLLKRLCCYLSFTCLGCLLACLRVRTIIVFDVTLRLFCSTRCIDTAGVCLLGCLQYSLAVKRASARELEWVNRLGLLFGIS